MVNFYSNFIACGAQATVSLVAGEFCTEPYLIYKYDIYIYIYE